MEQGGEEPLRDRDADGQTAEAAVKQGGEEPLIAQDAVEQGSEEPLRAQEVPWSKAVKNHSEPKMPTGKQPRLP